MMVTSIYMFMEKWEMEANWKGIEIRDNEGFYWGGYETLMIALYDKLIDKGYVIDNLLDLTWYINDDSTITYTENMEY